MKNWKKTWKFLKQPEFLITTVIAVVLALVGGFFGGKSYIINGDYAQLKIEYVDLEKEYTNYKQTVQNSPGSIITQDQDGNNLIEQNIDINEYPKSQFSYKIISLNQKQDDGLYATNIEIEYRSVPGVPLVPFNYSNQFISCKQLGKTNKALVPVNDIETWTTASYLCLSKEPVVESEKLFRLAE